LHKDINFWLSPESRQAREIEPVALVILCWSSMFKELKDEKLIFPLFGSKLHQPIYGLSLFDHLYKYFEFQRSTHSFC
jgi:hypothetical protein